MLLVVSLSRQNVFLRQWPSFARAQLLAECGSWLVPCCLAFEFSLSDLADIWPVYLDYTLSDGFFWVYSKECPLTNNFILRIFCEIDNSKQTEASWSRSRNFPDRPSVINRYVFCGVCDSVAPQPSIVCDLIVWFEFTNCIYILETFYCHLSSV